jgi:hypothetical protein
MGAANWPEAANRRLRAFLWKGWPLREVAAALGRSDADVASQMQRLGIVRRGTAQSAIPIRSRP